jgi:hypothetical protein
MTDPRQLTQAGVLAEAIAGIAEARHPRDADPDAPWLTASVIEATGDGAVRAEIEVPSGDRFEITVRWLGEQSP